MRNQIGRFIPAIFAIALSIAPGTAAAGNLHLIDQLPNGFRIYRSGIPSEADMREFARLGVEEIAVLSGDARRREARHRRAAPMLEVVYDEKQDVRRPLTASFLRWFDEWVETARREGKVIAFRCRCGCHRTGRLAAYYQMKYQGLTADEAIAVMNELGRNMFLHPELEPQVRALEDFIHGRPCSRGEQYCVSADEASGSAAPRPAARSGAAADHARP
jgi:hypothetical protein